MSRQLIDNRSLTEEVYEALRADVLSCRVPPGERLKISQICSARSFSLGAVREALARLTSEGLVVAESHKGYRAAPVSIEDLQDLTSTRVDVEAACLRRAIQHGDVEWETGIVAAFHRLFRTPERAHGDVDRLSDEWASAHKEFHLALASACDSAWRLRLRALLYDQTERYRRLSVPAAHQKRNLQAEHRAIMEATLARNSEKAVDLIERHFSVTSALVSPLAKQSRLSQRAASANRAGKILVNSETATPGGSRTLKRPAQL